VRDVAKKPVKFVIESIVNKGIVGGFNKIAGKFGVKEMPEVKLPKGFATGGRVSGPGTSTSDSVPARLSNNEHVLTAKDVKNMGGHSNVYAMRRAAASGWTPGLASGGTLIDAANWWVAKGARGSRHPAFGGAVRSGHSRNSLHYQDRAVDLNYGPGGQDATEMAFFDKWLGEFKSKFPGSRTIWRAPWHYNHLHIDPSNGADIRTASEAACGGGGASSFSLLILFEKLFDRIKKGAGDSSLPKLMGAVAKKRL